MTDLDESLWACKKHRYNLQEGAQSTHKSLVPGRTFQHKSWGFVLLEGTSNSPYAKHKNSINTNLCKHFSSPFSFLLNGGPAWSSLRNQCYFESPRWWVDRQVDLVQWRESHRGSSAAIDWLRRSQRSYHFLVRLLALFLMSGNKLETKKNDWPKHLVLPPKTRRKIRTKSRRIRKPSKTKKKQPKEKSTEAGHQLSDHGKASAAQWGNAHLGSFVAREPPETRAASWQSDPRFWGATKERLEGRFRLGSNSQVGVGRYKYMVIDDSLLIS